MFNDNTLIAMSYAKYMYRRMDAAKLRWYALIQKHAAQARYAAKFYDGVLKQLESEFKQKASQ